MDYPQEANPYLVEDDRKKTIFTGTTGRDLGRQYFIKEMPAAKGEKWAAKGMAAMVRSGLNIGNASGGGMLALAYFGTQAIGQLPWHELEPLMDEMFLYVWRVADPKSPANSVRPLVLSDISEIITRAQIRDKFLELTLGFSITESFLRPLLAETGGKSSVSTSSTTPTSPPPSEPSYPPARPAPRNLRRLARKGSTT